MSNITSRNLGPLFLCFLFLFCFCGSRSVYGWSEFYGSPLAAIDGWNCKHDCLTNQRSLVHAIESYEHEHTANVYKLTPKLLKKLVKLRYLGSIPNDPGFGEDTSSNYLVFSERRLFCLNHGFIKPRCNPGHSSYRQLIEEGEKGIPYLSIASPNPSRHTGIRRQLIFELEIIYPFYLIYLFFIFTFSLPAIMLPLKRWIKKQAMYPPMTEENIEQVTPSVSKVYRSYLKSSKWMAVVFGLTLLSPLLSLVRTGKIDTFGLFIGTGTGFFIAGALLGAIYFTDLISVSSPSGLKFSGGNSIPNSILTGLLMAPSAYCYGIAMAFLSWTATIPASVSLYIFAAFFCGKFLMVTFLANKFLHYLPGLLAVDSTSPPIDVAEAMELRSKHDKL